jgi:hypothetical protein
MSLVAMAMVASAQTLRPEGGRPTASNPPRLALSSRMSVPNEVQVGDALVITASAYNSGGGAIAGSISVSFSGAVDQNRVTVLDKSGFSSVKLYRPGSPVLILGYKKAQPSRYWLAEGYTASGWRNGEEKYLSFELIPNRPGVIRVWVRATASTATGGKASNHYNAPNSSPNKDQQGFGAWLYEVKVNR